MPDHQPEEPHVLIVDDEEPLADLFARLLADEYQTSVAHDGQTALEILDESIDVVLLDRRMPQMSGDEVLNTVRARDIETQVAMVTAVDPDFDVMDMGFDDYVLKPVQKSELNELVERLLSRRSYGKNVQRLYALASKLAAIETTTTETERASNEDYQEMKASIADLKGQLQDAFGTFDDGELDKLYRDLEDLEPE